MTTATVSSPVTNMEGDITVNHSDGTETVVGRVYRSGDAWVATDGTTDRKFKTHRGATDFMARKAFGW